ncbi:EAL domain-containing protein [Azoarcus sp. L1K30]|uniref:putative bifunctional diguanylate cyclase/phosphodiesterase n=1 Tax=Azoarcus sp. L1K30 TaxID=2820277 RepID=UPI001B8438C6|nr:EAL domain-containing protein [Azoarcus sp. L1K30]MBR0568118.1 EAL domain-containing protein [Azoarcus sp. L1K30]
MTLKMKRPSLLPVLASLAQLGLPVIVFIALWSVIGEVERQAHEMEQAQGISRFQRAAAQQVERIQRELDTPAGRRIVDPQSFVPGLLGNRRDARDVSIEIIDLAGSHPTPIYQDPDLRPAAMMYVEQIRVGQQHWLVEVSPLAGHYLLKPSASVETLRWGGPLIGFLGAALVILLQSRSRSVRRQVLRQTSALEHMNHQLERSNSALQAEIARSTEAERSLRNTTTLQRAILDGSEYAIVSTDPEGLIELFNPAAERIFGWRAAEVCGRATPVLLYPAEEVDRLERMHGKGFLALVGDARDGIVSTQQELTLRRKNGETFPASLSVSPLHGPDGTIRGYLGIASDIGERKAAESRIRFLAHYDALTELPNRNYLGQRLSDALERCKRQDRQLALLFLDLDRFKYVNDSLGHQAGDLLLQAVSRRFMSCVRADDTVARTGGDEFVILLPSLHDRGRVVEVASRILAALRDPFDIRGQRLTISPSIGIAIYPDDGADAETLIKHADAAMYQAKEAGRNAYRFFDQQLSRRASERLMIENELRLALERKEFVLYYQPQLDVASGEITGMEALLRWQHPERGLVPPDAFIPIAEDSGLIVPIGDWVLRTACAQAHAWRVSGLIEVPVAVNLSARQFDQPDLPAQIASVLQATGLPTHCLELELTESLVMRDPERSSDTLSRCKALGVSIAVDDFGTGYSSLAYLRRFPINRLKIDRSFIKDIVDEPDDAAIAQTIIAMAHSLRLSVVAEGVERLDQLRLLQHWQCDMYQGFLSSRPLPGDALTALLKGMRAAGVTELAPPVPQH